MTVEPRCPTCVPDAAPASTRRPTRTLAPKNGGVLTFLCRCGRAAAVSTAKGPGQELARLGWTFRFVAD